MTTLRNQTSVVAQQIDPQSSEDLGERKFPEDGFDIVEVCRVHTLKMPPIVILEIEQSGKSGRRGYECLSVKTVKTQVEPR